MGKDLSSNELLQAKDTLASILKTLGEYALPTSTITPEEYQAQCQQLARELLLKMSAVGDEDKPQSVDHNRSYQQAKAIVRKQRQIESQEYRAHRSSAAIIVADLVKGLRHALQSKEHTDQEIVTLLDRLQNVVDSGDLEAIRQTTTEATERIRSIITDQRDKEKQLIETLSQQLRSMRQELGEARTKMQRDALTELYNRGAFDEALPQTMRFCQASGTDLTLFLLDIDHFKKVNDSHGHPAGDAVLQAVSRQLAKSFLRRDDMVARYGGEEFVVFCRDLGDDFAHTVAERARKAIAKLAVEYDGLQIHPTVSIGYAVMKPEEDPASLVQRADQALYQAKQSGRNRVAAAKK